MNLFYTDPTRENNKHAWPDAVVFYVEQGKMWDWFGEDSDNDAGFYWQPCLPDGEPIGPFETEEEAIQDARGEA